MAVDEKAIDHICEETEKQVHKSADVKCITSVCIMPTRYGVVGCANSKTLNSIAPPFPANLTLGSGLSTTALISPANEHARYAVRAMRHGHIYIFSNRKYTENKVIKTHWLLDGHFECDENAFLSKNGEFPNSHIGRTRLFFTIFNPKDITELRILFTPAELTEQRVTDIIKDEALRNKIQKIDIEALTNNESLKSTVPADIIPLGQLSDVLVDLMGYIEKNKGSSVLTEMHEALANQLYTQDSNKIDAKDWQGTNVGYSDGLVNNIKAHAEYINNAQQGKEKDKSGTVSSSGAAIVLNDPIGITQELNNWRNEAPETHFYAGYLNREVEGTARDKKGNATNERLIRSIYAYEMLEKTYPSLRMCADVKTEWEAFEKSLTTLEAGKYWIHSEQYNLFKEDEQTYRAYYEQNPSDEGALETAHLAKSAAEDLKNKVESLNTQVKPSVKAFRTALDQAYGKEESYKTEFKNMLAPLYDHSRTQAIKERYKQEWDKAQEVVKTRVAAHISWLQSAALLNALDFYDPNDSHNGADFTEAIGLSLIGVDQLEKQYKVLLDAWWLPDKDPFDDERSNLLMRAFCFNNSKAFQAIKAIDDAAVALETEIEKLKIDDFDSLSEYEKEKRVPSYAQYIDILRSVANTFKAILLYDSKKLGPLAETLKLSNAFGQRLAGALVVVQKFQRNLINLGASTQLEYRAFNFFRNILVVQLGDEVKAAALATQYAHNPNKRLKRVVISGRLLKEWDKGFKGRSTFADIRVGGIVIVCHCIVLMAQIFRAGSLGFTREEVVRIYGLAMATVGSLYSYLSIAIEASLGSYKLDKMRANAAPGRPGNRISYDASKVRGAKFKLIGAGLASMGMVPIVLIEVKYAAEDFVDSLEEGNWILTTGYGASLLLNVGLIGMTLFSTQTALKELMVAVTEKAAHTIGRTSAVAVRGAVARTAIGTTIARLGASSGAAVIAGLGNPFTLGGAVAFIAISALWYAFKSYDSSRSYEVDLWLKRAILALEGGDSKKPYDSLTIEMERHSQTLVTLSAKVPLEVLHWSENFIVLKQFESEV